jgi:uncharacterized protein (TIGR02145 family)
MIKKYICINNSEHVFETPTPDFWCPSCSIDKRSMLILSEINEAPIQIEPDPIDIPTTLPIAETLEVPIVKITTSTLNSEGSAKVENFDNLLTYIFEPIGPQVDNTGKITNATVGISYILTSSKDTIKSLPSTPFVIEHQLVELVPAAIELTLPTAESDGKAKILNYDPLATYSFYPPGPVVLPDGEIDLLFPGLEYKITVSKGNQKSKPSEGFKIIEKLEKAGSKPFQQLEFLQIGSQKWTSTYLTLTELQNGEKLFFAKTNSEWLRANQDKIPAYCLPHEDVEYSKKVGYLYNWFAAKTLQRDLKEMELKIPDTGDIHTLFDYLEKNNQDEFVDNFYSTMGTSLKYRFPMATYIPDSDIRYFWTINEDLYYTAYAYSVTQDRKTKIQKIGKNAGFFIRCIR